MKFVTWSALIALSFATLFAQTPVIAGGGITNAASFDPGSGPAPGSLVLIFGSNLASGLMQGDTVPLSSSIGGVSVTFNGVTAPLYFVSPSAIEAQVPWEVIPDPTVTGTAAVVVNGPGGSSAAQNVSINPFSPAIYRVQMFTGQAMVLNSDGTLSAATGSVPGYQSHPAANGDTLVMYANGLGQVTPNPTTGSNSSDTQRSNTTTPVVMIGGVQAQVTFSGLSPQFVGVNQLNVVVPQGVPAGNATPIQIQVGGITTAGDVTIATAGQ